MVRPGRLEGWEQRLAALVQEARGWTYELGVRDCLYLMCRDIEAMTGVDRWPECAGYRTRREMLAGLARHGSTFEKAADWFFGTGRVGVRLARRGDAAAFATPDGSKHLSVVIEGFRMACFVRTAGLVIAPLTAAHAAWKVG